DYNHIAVVVGVWLFVVVKNLFELFPLNAQIVCEIVVSGGDDDFLRAVVMNLSGTVGGCNSKIPILASDRLDPLILADMQLVVLSDTAIVLERLLPGGFLAGTREWNVADLQQLRCREERHVGGVVENRIHEATLVQNDRLQSDLLGF